MTVGVRNQLICADVIGVWRQPSLSRVDQWTSTLQLEIGRAGSGVHVIGVYAVEVMWADIEASASSRASAVIVVIPNHLAIRTSRWNVSGIAGVKDVIPDVPVDRLSASAAGDDRTRTTQIDRIVVSAAGD